MIHCSLELETVKELQANCRLRAFLSDIEVVDHYGETGKFMMDIPIEQQIVNGPKGSMVVFYQEELGDEE